MSQDTTQESTPDIPHMRILVCRSCTTVDEIPDWEGRVEDDPYLQVVVDKHGPSHEGQLFRLPIGLWLMEDAKKHIIEQVRGGSKCLAAFDPEYYNTRSTFMEDAQKCYQLHLRPKGQCPEFRSERKQLLPNTKAERKEAGLPLTPTGPKAYLCDFCPVRVYNEKKIFEAHNK